LPQTLTIYSAWIQMAFRKERDAHEVRRQAMLEFLQSYGLWILLGGGFLFLMTRGGGCGMGHGQNAGHEDQSQDREVGYRSSADQSRLVEATSQPIADDTNRQDVKTPVGAHSGGCH
jgi:hypothetical protein